MHWNLRRGQYPMEKIQRTMDFATDTRQNRRGASGCRLSAPKRASVRPPAFALTDAYAYGILMHMRTTIIIKEDVLSKASALTGVKEKTALVHMGLEALIARASAARLARLGKSERGLRPIPRRRIP